MKKIIATILSLGLATSLQAAHEITPLKNVKSWKMYIVNNSENLNFQVEYLRCVLTNCTGPYSISIPNAKHGKNYIVYDFDIDRHHKRITKIIGTDDTGAMKIITEYDSSFYPNCTTESEGSNSNANALILDNLHSDDVIFCTKSNAPR